MLELKNNLGITCISNLRVDNCIFDNSKETHYDYKRRRMTLYLECLKSHEHTVCDGILNYIRQEIFFGETWKLLFVLNKYISITDTFVNYYAIKLKLTLKMYMA